MISTTLAISMTTTMTDMPTTMMAMAATIVTTPPLEVLQELETTALLMEDPRLNHFAPIRYRSFDWVALFIVFLRRYVQCFVFYFQHSNFVQSQPKTNLFAHKTTGVHFNFNSLWPAWSPMSTFYVGSTVSHRQCTRGLFHF